MDEPILEHSKTKLVSGEHGLGRWSHRPLDGCPFEFQCQPCSPQWAARSLQSRCHLGTQSFNASLLSEVWKINVYSETFISFDNGKQTAHAKINWSWAGMSFGMYTVHVYWPGNQRKWCIIWNVTIYRQLNGIFDGLAIKENWMVEPRHLMGNTCVEIN